MKRLVAAVALLAGLAGCSSLTTNPTIAGGVAGTILPASTVSALQQTCQAAQPGLVAATGTNMPATISGGAVYFETFCAQLLAGTVPATADANSPSWLTTGLAALKVAAQVAGIVLPLL